MNDKDLILWAICSSIQIISCIRLLYIEKDRENYKEIFLWLILGITPMSMFIIIGIFMILLISGICFSLEYIAEKLFNLTKKK